MENSTAPSAIENTVLKKVDHLDVLDIVYPHPVSTYVYKALPLDRWRNRWYKRAFDLFFSSLLLLVLIPLLLPFVALLIRINSRGPVFFLQKRTGKEGRLFTCIKFRTMVVNREADTMPACKNDVRITSLGKFLRRHHIDELPQLLNVWMGDMSIIGPRPYMLADDNRYSISVEHYEKRLAVKPGMTGLAQASGHFGILLNIAEMKQRVALDLEYISEWSAVLDLKIIYRTMRMMWDKQTP